MIAALVAAHPARYPFFLESVATGTPQSRYSLLLGGVGERITADDAAVVNRGGFLAAFAEAWRREATPPSTSHRKTLPFEGGWFVYLGYELAAEIEPNLNLPSSPFALPKAVAVRSRAALVYDHGIGELFAVAEEKPLLARLLADIEAVPPPPSPPPLSGLRLVEAPSAPYLKALARCRAYIYSGDIFQVNLSRPWHAELPGGTANYHLYRRLCRANPSPFAALAVFADDLAILSSSPERLVRVEGSSVQTRPIAGTRARNGGKADKKDSRLLTASPKERAEHLMLLDLERNDLSKICKAGTVRVDEMMTVESYRHVHHIVSNVVGELGEGVTPTEVIRAVFPGGTITGCPKVRCMEILAESEKVGRGPYTGSLGYICNDGDMDLNILIRSILRQGDEAHFRAGGGIVADSRAKRELAETTAKADGLIRALVG